jgi:dihydropyrimidinase
MRRFITASDVELVSLTGQTTLVIDEDDVVTGRAREMAAKLGVTIEKNVSFQTLPAPSPSPRAPTSSTRRSAKQRPWVPAELSKREPEDASGDILLTNGTVVWPGQGTFQADISVADGKIASLGLPGTLPAGRAIDVAGKLVLPGIIDPHVHLGIFNSLEEDLEKETKAALWGGLTTLGCFRYNKNSYLSELDHLYEAVSQHSSVDLVFHLTIASREHLDEIPRYVADYGIRSFKVYMSGVPGIIPDVDDGFMTEVYEKLLATEQPCTVCIHAENPSLVRWATDEIQSKDGKGTTIQEWSETHPAIAEEEAIRRAAFLTKEFSGIATYFVHISSKGGIEAVSQIKCDRVNVYAETTSPYLLFSIEDVAGNVPKWLPPLRTRESAEALWENLKRGKIDTLGTDSVPMSSEIKGLDKSVWEAMPNAPLMEHHLPGILTEGVIQRGVPVDQIIDRMTRRPAEIFGLYPKKGSLMPGADADLVVVDMEARHKVDKDRIRSASSFSLFEGAELTGWPAVVIKGGKLVVQDGEWIGDPDSCRVLNSPD